MWELTNASTPPKVVIDEAIELAKSFSTEQSPAFVNGVLDAVLKENVALKSDGTEEGTEASAAADRLRHEGTEGETAESNNREPDVGSQ